ncbi:MAG: hypothetical protein DCC74_09210 [Proteobacteria bacterium]|nr:MAG: hypothetical protein DCC74_09210 [Pseudomonadota bacterium]
MSKSAKTDDRPALFDDWIVAEYDRTEGFTALVVLLAISELEVVPLRSTFVHVVGDDLSWHDFYELMSGAGVAWQGVVIMSAPDVDGGPIDDAQARAELADLEKRIIENRLVINEGHFFDQWGRRMKVEEAMPN